MSLEAIKQETSQVNSVVVILCNTYFIFVPIFVPMMTLDHDDFSVEV